MTDTQDISNDLSAWIDGELSDARAKQVAEAVQADPALAAEADELRQVASLIGQLGGPGELPANFAQRVAEQAIQHKTSRFPHWASFCVAASVLIATGTALMLFQDNDTYQTSLAYHSEEDAKRDEGTAAGIELDAVDDAVELGTEADALHRRPRELVDKRASKVLNEDFAKKELNRDAFKGDEEISASGRIAAPKPGPQPIRFRGKGGGNQKLSDRAAKVNKPPLAALVKEDLNKDGQVTYASKAGRDISELRAIAVPEPSALTRRYTGKGRDYKGLVEQPAEVAITPVAPKPRGPRRIGKKSSAYAKTQDWDADAENRLRRRAGPGPYDAVSNMAQARTEAQATVTMMQSDSPIVRKASTIVLNVPGGPPGQQAIQLQAFRMDQQPQPENREQTETVYVKSLDAGQKRIEGLLSYNGIEMVKQNQPLLNNGQAVLVGGWNNVARAQATQPKPRNTSSADSKTDTPVTGQLQYMVFGGKTQIKELRRQVSVLNASIQTAEAKKKAADASVKVPEKEIVPEPILAELKPTPIPNEPDVAQTETLAKNSKPAAKAPSAKPTSSEPLRQIKTPAVDILIIMVEERK